MNMRKEVKLIVDAWDPERLLSLGAPDDEYESEVEMILSLRPCDASQCRRMVASVFSAMFDDRAWPVWRVPEEVADKLFAIIGSHTSEF